MLQPNFLGFGGRGGRNHRHKFFKEKSGVKKTLTEIPDSSENLVGGNYRHKFLVGETFQGGNYTHNPGMPDVKRESNCLPL